MNDHSRAIARNAAVVGGATLISRILGFARDLIIAFALGAGPLADAFFVAFRLPNLLRRLFGEGSLTMAFVPVFTRLREEDGEPEAHAFARSTLFWLVCILGVLSLGAGVLARPIVLLVAPGFADDPELMATTAELVRICFPYILFISGVALCMGILNASGRFLAPALAPCALNVVLIAAALTGVAMGWSVPHCLAWGVLAAGLLQWLMQQSSLKASGFSWRGPWSPRHPGVGRTARLMLPTVFGAAVYQINIILGTVFASFLASGSISYLYYADRLVQFPLGVFGVAVSTAALPSLSALAAKNQMDDFTETLSAGLRLTLFISLPAAAGLIALAEPVVGLLFGRGAFGHGAISATAWALVGYGVGLPAFAVVRPLVSAYYALGDTRTPRARRRGKPPGLRGLGPRPHAVHRPRGPRPGHHHRLLGQRRPAHARPQPPLRPLGPLHPPNRPLHRHVPRAGRRRLLHHPPGPLVRSPYPPLGHGLRPRLPRPASPRGPYGGRRVAAQAAEVGIGGGGRH